MLSVATSPHGCCDGTNGRTAPRTSAVTGFVAPFATQPQTDDRPRREHPDWALATLVTPRSGAVSCRQTANAIITTTSGGHDTSDTEESEGGIIRGFTIVREALHPNTLDARW